MRIAICDDENHDLIALETMTKEYFAPKRMDLSVFSSAAELYDAAGKKPFDLVILDIEMESPNGYEIACKLISHKPKPLIIFVTNSMAYTIRGYGVAFRYLPKPLITEQFRDAMDAAVKELNANRFIFSADGTDHVVKMEDIYYLEVFNHHTVLHTMDAEYTFRATLKEVQAVLPAGYFGMPHQSYVVNFSHVKTASPKQIQLTNGSCIPVSRRKQKEFEGQLHQYLGR